MSVQTEDDRIITVDAAVQAATHDHVLPYPPPHLLAHPFPAPEHLTDEVCHDQVYADAAVYKQNIIPSKVMFLQMTLPSLTAPFPVQRLRTRSGLASVAVSSNSFKQKTNFNNIITPWMTGVWITCYDMMSATFATLRTCGLKEIVFVK